MEKLRMESKDILDDKVNEIAKIFPNVVTEVASSGVGVRHLLDYGLLKQELSDVVIDENAEKYQFTWPDKKKSRLLANSPVRAALRPCIDKSVDFDTTKNLYIEGDNLDVIKLLRETYLGKIKVIYIDPPYNTGSDFIYEDDFAMSIEEYHTKSGDYDGQGNRLTQNPASNGRIHTDWLNMIYPRLKVARDLLSEDGVIFISIDDNEYANLKNVCDEVFGERNFSTNFVWQSTAGSNTGTEIITVTEYILMYAKNRDKCVFNGRPADENTYTLSDEYVSERGNYTLDKLERRRVGPHYSEALNYPIEMPDGSKRWPGGGSERSDEGWNYLWSESKVQWGIKEGFIVFTKQDGEWGVYNKRYFKVDNNGNEVNRTIPYRNLITSDVCTTSNGTSEIRSLFDLRPFDFPKPTALIKYLLSTVIKEDKEATVLDFFSGSATTAHSVMQLNAEDGGSRKFIMVQLPEVCGEDSEAYKAGYRTICEIGEERIRRAGKKIKEEVGLMAQNLDIGFRVLKLDSSNMKDVYYNPDQTSQQSIEDMLSNVKEDRTPMDLLFQVMLETDVLLSSKIDKKNIEGRNVFIVNDNDLICCFDDDIGDDVVKAIAQMKPLYAVFRDSSFKSDDTMVNAEQYFRTYAPDTQYRII